MVKEKVKKNFVAEVMNTSLFSIEEKLKIINKVRKDDLSDREINDILKLIKRFNEGLTEVKEEYNRGMDRVYAEYLDKNIPIVKQWVEKMELEVKEIRIDEEEWDPDLLLDQIN